MCTITLSYNENDKVANEKLAALLGTGLFVQLHRHEEIALDYSDSALFEDDETASDYEKEEYSPEELRALLVSDLNKAYNVK